MSAIRVAYARHRRLAVTCVADSRVCVFVHVSYIECALLRRQDRLSEEGLWAKCLALFA